MNHTIQMTGNGPTRLIAEGHVDLFAHDEAQSPAERRLHHLTTLSEGTVFQDIAPIESEGIKWAVTARLARGTKLKKVQDEPAYAGAQCLEDIGKLPAKLDEEARLAGVRQHHAEQLVFGTVERLTDVNRKLTRFDAHDYNGNDELLAACEAAGAYMGVEIKAPTTDVADSSLSPIEAILHLSRIRYREVTLTGKWWKRNSSPMIGRLKDETPVTLLPRGLNGYSLFNPKTGETKKLTEDTAKEMLPVAHSLYRTFPAKKLNALSIVKFAAGSHIIFEAAIILLFTTLASMVMVMPPIISAQIFTEIVPSHARGLLVKVIFVLIAFQIAQIGFNVITNLGFSRIKTKMDLALQSAVWDRLLGQNIQFFYNYATGELLEKMSGLKVINDTLSLDLLKSTLNALFSFVNLIVMYRYIPEVTRQLFWPFAILFAVSMLLSYRKYRLGKQQIKVMNESSAYNHQMIAGIQRIKTSYAEARAFWQWGEFEAKRRDVEGHIRLMDSLRTAAKTLFALAAVAYIYLLISRIPGVAPGTFVAFIGSYMIFQAAMLNLTDIIDLLFTLGPVLKNVEPLLESVPDDLARRATPKDIDGSLELNHVSFNYEEYGRTILHDISLRIDPGQSVGIVGLSGCGKTTLMKLMLGLYEPSGGEIYFGGYDLSRIDTHFLRRQLGVVMQNGELSFGSIYSNITQGRIDITEADVIEALKVVELYDFVQALPHGIYTSLDAEHIPLSGGQVQLLLIARAIVTNRPHFFFDEASSKLDNVLTMKIMRHITKMPGTKIIIAQRLATIEQCDRIIVMDNGRVIAEGPYDEIINKQHMFGVIFEQADDEDADTAEESAIAHE